MAANAPKMMSSRLMTMKFMQRSAARTPASPSPSDSNSPSTPTSAGPSKKRVRLSAGGFAPAPTEAEILQNALDEEERKRVEAVERAAEKAGESKWVLSIPQDPTRTDTGLKVNYAGFATIDQDDDDDGLESGEEVEGGGARMTFGGGVKRAGGKKKQQVAAESEQEDSHDSDSDESESSDYDSDDPTAEMIREAKRDAAAKAKEDKRERKRRESKVSSAYDTPKRPNLIDEDMDLGGLQSISGGRPSALSGSGKKDMQCFSCGGKGHFKDECPKKGGGGPQRRGSQKGPRGGSKRGGGGLSGRQRF